MAFVSRAIRRTKATILLREAGSARLGKSTGYDPALIAQVWEHEGYPAALPADLLDVLEAEEDWLARQAGRPARTRAELSKLIDRSVLDEALSRQ